MAKELDPWSFMLQFIQAGINPALLEAYCRPGPLPDLPDEAFLKEALDALSLLQKVLKNSFESLTMERKIALIDLILARGAKEFSSLLKGTDSHDEDTLIQALERKLGPWGEREKRAVQALSTSQLVFADTALNEARTGKLKLQFGSRGIEVRYLHRLLYVVQRYLEMPQLKQDPFDFFNNNTSNAISAFQQKVSQEIPDRSDPCAPDLYMLRLLEYVVLVKQPSKKHQKRGMQIIEEKDHKFKVTFKHFDSFVDFYCKLVQAFGPGPAPAFEAKDAQAALYLLGYLQEENKEFIEEMEKKLKAVGEDASRFVRKVWKRGWLGKAEVSAPIAVTALLLLRSILRVKKNEENQLDERLLEGAGALLQLVKMGNKQKTEQGVRTQRSGWLYQIGLKGPANKSFKNAKKETVEGPGGGAEISLTYFRNKPLGSKVDYKTLKDNGFNDKRLWYCEATETSYTTYELRDMLEEGEITEDLVVRDIMSKERERVRVGDIPAVMMKPHSLKNGGSVTLGANAAYVRDTQEDANRIKAGATLEGRLGSFGMAVSTNLQNVKEADLANIGQALTGLSKELELRLSYEASLMKSQGPDTQTLGGSLAFKQGQTTFPDPQFNSSFTGITTKAQWKVHRNHKQTITATAEFYYPLEYTNVKEPSPQKLDLSAGIATKKITATFTASLLPEQPLKKSTFGIRLIFCGFSK